MYVTSAEFKTYANDPNSKSEIKVVIDEVEFLMDSIVEFEIEDSIATEDDFELGGGVTSRFNLTLKTISLIGKNAEMKPYVRYVSGLNVSEWLPLGVFRVDSRTYQNGLWRFVCFDALIKAQKTYETDLLFPNTMYQVLIEACYNLGIELPESLLESINLAYTINTKPEDGSITFRDMIRFIASSHGKVAKLDKLGQLEFRGFATRTTQYEIEKAVVKHCEETNPLKTIEKIVWNYNSNLEPIILGDGDEDVTLWLYNPYVTEDMANTIFTDLYGLSYQPVSSSWYCRPDVETADFISIETRDETYATIILRNMVRFAGGMLATITSPSSTGQQSEYGFDGTIGQAVAEVGKRIGLFAHATNTAKKTIKQIPVQVALMPLTTASETNIEFVVTCNGVASVDSVLRVTFRISGSDVGREIRVPVKAGLVGNFISFSTLRAKVPKISDWLFCRMVVDAGNFVIEKNECEFYIYGGNIVSGDVKPILEFEEIITDMLPMNEELNVVFPVHISIGISDSIDSTVSLTDILGGVVID